jgi:hypothetical protein
MKLKPRLRKLTQSEFIALVLISVLTAWDYAYTVIGVNDFSEERNPLARWFLQQNLLGIDLLGVVKLSLPLLLGLVIASTRSDTRRTKIGLWTAVAIYVVATAVILMYSEVLLYA